MGAALTVYQLFYEPAKADAATQAPHKDGEEATALSDFKRDRVPTTVLQNETLVDVFSHLSRDDIDLIRFGSGRLRQVIDDCMATVCLRHIMEARIAGNCRKDPSSFDVTVARKLQKDEETEKKDTSENGDSATTSDSPRVTRSDSEEKVEQTFKDPFEAINFLLKRLKSSVVVGTFTVYRLALSCDFCDKLAEMGSLVFINDLYVDSLNAAPESLRRFLTRCFAEVRSAMLNSYNGLYPSDISDALVRECAANGVYKLFLDTQALKHADRFLLSDDGILDFCFGHKEDKPIELKAYNIVVSPQFFDRLVQANKKSKLTARMHIKVKVVRDPLFDTSNYERNRKQFGTMQVYDFPGDVRFQILLYPHNAHQNPQEWTIDLRRCKEPTDGSRFFY